MLLKFRTEIARSNKGICDWMTKKSAKISTAEALFKGDMNPSAKFDRLFNPQVSIPTKYLQLKYFIDNSLFTG